MKRIQASLLLFFTFLSVHAGELEYSITNFSATPTFVFDGDTISVLADGEEFRVRFFRIDAPEMEQRYGEKSRKFLENILTDKLQLKCYERDHYQRWICDVYTDQNVWVNKELVQNGLAWYYYKFAKHPELDVAQKSAKSARKGLWADRKPIPPWKWRRMQRDRQKFWR